MVYVRVTALFVLLTSFVSSSEAADRKDVIANAKAATALVDLEELGSGSAFCIDPQGLFITNYHVVGRTEIGGDVTLILNPAQINERKITAKYLKYDMENDLALLKADATEPFPSIALGDDSNVTETDEVTVFGYPFGRMLASDRSGYPSISVNTGRISALRHQERKLRLIQIDAAVNPGNSGGPMLDDDGEVIGIVVSGIPGSSVSFAIPSSQLKLFLSAPVVMLKAPEIVFGDLSQPLKFELQVVPLPNSEPVKSAKLYVDCESIRSGPFTVENPQQQVRIEAVIDRDSRPADRLNVQIQSNGRSQDVRLSDLALRLDDDEVHLSEIRRIDRRGDRVLVTFNSRKKRLGKLTGWEAASDESVRTAGRSADRIDVYVIGSEPRELSYTLEIETENGSAPKLEGKIVIKGVPAALDDRGTVRDPFAPFVEKLHLKVQVDGTDKLTVARRGLLVEHVEGDKPGMPGFRGRYILVNGKQWYPSWEYTSADVDEADQSEIYPMRIGGAVWHLEQLRTANADDGRNNPARGKVTQVPESDELVLEFQDTEKGAGIYEVMLTRVNYDPKIEPIPEGPSVGGRWDFENVVDGVVPDVSGQNHDGKVVALPRAIPGVIGKGLLLTGVPMPVGSLGLAGYEGPFSYSLWMKTESGANGVPMGTIKSTGDQQGFDFFLSDRRVMVHLKHKWPDNVLRCFSNERVPLSEWSHITVTYDGNKTSEGVAIYINGRSVPFHVSHDSLTGSFHHDRPLFFGGRATGHVFRGSIDEVRFYKRELTAEDARMLASKDQPLPADLNQDLVAHWSFDQLEGNRLHEDSGQLPDAELPQFDTTAEVVEDETRGKVMRIRRGGWIDCGNIGNFERDQAFSFGGWVKSSELGWRYWQLVTTSRMETGPRWRGYRLEVAERGVVKVHLSHDISAKQYIEINSTENLPEREWHHLFATYDGSSRASGLKLYIDGKEVPVNVRNDRLEGTIRIDRPFVFGNTVSEETCDGLLDDVRLIDRCLTPEEVAELAGKKSAR